MPQAADRNQVSTALISARQQLLGHGTMPCHEFHPDPRRRAELASELLKGRFDTKVLYQRLTCRVFVRPIYAAAIDVDETKHQCIRRRWADEHIERRTCGPNAGRPEIDPDNGPARQPLEAGNHAQHGTVGSPRHRERRFIVEHAIHEAVMAKSRDNQRSLLPLGVAQDLDRQQSRPRCGPATR